MHSKDAEARYTAFQELLAVARNPVDWADEVWDGRKEVTRKGDSHIRTITVQLLCEPAQSDPKNNMLKDFDELLAVTGDGKFVTAPRSLQALWKIGRVGKSNLSLCWAVMHCALANTASTRMAHLFDMTSAWR